MKCKCGSRKFYASQIVYHDVITDERGFFSEEVGMGECENPHGPFTCVDCGAEYDDLNTMEERN